MADPRLVDGKSIHGRIARFSQFYRASQKAKKLGLVVNACPFGCEHDDLDDLGYCRHLVGFTSDRVTLERLVDPLPGQEKRRIDGQKREAVRKTDKLVRITNNFRVYRENVEPYVEPAVRPRKAKGLEPKAAAGDLDDIADEDDDEKPAGSEVDLPDEELEKLTRPDDTLRPITHNGKSLS